MQCAIFVILRGLCFFFFPLPPSADYAYVNIVSTNGKQYVLKQHEANTDLLYLSGLSFRNNNRVRVFETLGMAGHRVQN